MTDYRTMVPHAADLPLTGTRFASPLDLYSFVRQAWSADTICDPFDPSNPSRNQCAVTALAVHHYFGGDIFKTATKGGTHFYNRIGPSFWDLSAEQFGEPIPYDATPSSTAEAFRHASQTNFEQLIENIEARVAQTGEI